MGASDELGPVGISLTREADPNAEKTSYLRRLNLTSNINTASSTISPKMASLASIPRGGMILLNLAFMAGAYKADFNHTHIYNPRWPPHAKFHNGQSMSFGALAALAAIYLLAQPARHGIPAARDTLFAAALVGSLTTTAGLSAILYPGTAWMDPEFDTGAAVGPQAYIFAGQLALNWILYSIEKRRLVKLEKSE